ncbi:MAG: hypothetical protein SGILL_000088 [Bacillariaceae sp.]
MFLNTEFLSTLILFALTPKDGTLGPWRSQQFSNPQARIGHPRLFSTLVGRPVEESKYIGLLQWLEENGAFISDKIELTKSAQGDGYGAFVSQPVEAGELLFQIPRGLCLTLEDATKNDEDCGEAFQALIDKAGPGANTVVMAAFMAKEYLVSQEKSDNKQSSWGPYFATLPWERGINNQEHILFYTEENLEKLRGSLCWEEANALRDEVALAIKILGPVISKPIREARGEDTGFKFPWQVTQQQEVEGLSDAIKGAFVCLLTRSFQDGDDDAEKLVPLLDLLQHSETPNIRHEMKVSQGLAVVVRARCDIEAGTELRNQYRSEEEESMPYARFFTRFGFVPGITEPIENLLQDKSSIFFPKKMEV